MLLGRRAISLLTAAGHSRSNHPDLWEETAVLLPFHFFDVQLSEKPRSLLISLGSIELVKISRNRTYFIFTVTWVIYEICYSMRFVVVCAT